MVLLNANPSSVKCHTHFGLPFGSVDLVIHGTQILNKSLGMIYILAVAGTPVTNSVAAHSALESQED